MLVASCRDQEQKCDYLRAAKIKWPVYEVWRYVENRESRRKFSNDGAAYAVTVPGTVRIESALFGIPVASTRPRRLDPAVRCGFQPRSGRVRSALICGSNDGNLAIFALELILKEGQRVENIGF